MVSSINYVSYLICRKGTTFSAYMQILVPKLMVNAVDMRAKRPDFPEITEVPVTQLHLRKGSGKVAEFIEVS